MPRGGSIDSRSRRSSTRCRPRCIARSVRAYRFYAPSLDLTVYTVDDTTREWLLVAVDGAAGEGGWAIADAEVWDDEGRFSRTGRRRCICMAVSGDPPTIDASRRT